MTGIAKNGGGRSPWADIVGPCYTVRTLSNVLGVSRQEVMDAAASLQLLRLRTADGVDLFPAFQVRSGRLHPGKPSVLAVLRSGIDDPWTWAEWLNSPGCDGIVAIDDLWEGNVLDVLREAECDAWAWRSSGGS